MLICNNMPHSILIYIRICQALDAFVNAAEFADSAFIPSLSNNKALVLFRLGRQEECMTSFLEALSSASSPEAALFYNRGAWHPPLPLHPQSRHAHDPGTVHLKLADWTAAARDFEAAIGINAELPVFHYAFSVALERIGRRNEA